MSSAVSACGEVQADVIDKFLTSHAEANTQGALFARGEARVLMIGVQTFGSLSAGLRVMQGFFDHEELPPP